VVGVVGDVHSSGSSTGPEGTLYVPQAQAPTSDGYLVVRLPAPLGSVAQALREAIWRADPSIAVGQVRMLEEVIDELTADQRIIALLITAYASTALVVTLVSLYAIVAHLVVRHRREYAIRAALGASPRRILGNAMRRALAAALFGTLLGTALAVGLGRMMASLLHGITPLEPSVFGVLPALLLGVFALAIYLPARKAAKVDPMTTLRT
jgi:ABC-type antimicrobial peptide transport system permease subunit